MSQVATLLYEDAPADQRFGPHEFVMSCVLDRVNGEQHRVRSKIDGRAMKGNGNVIRTVHDDFEDLARDGRCVIAVLDSDQVHKLLKLPASADLAAIKRVVVHDHPHPERVEVFALQRNTESLLQAIRDCDCQVNQEQLEFALLKDRNARDIVLREAASEKNRAKRACVLDRVPSLKGLVQFLSDLALRHIDGTCDLLGELR